MKFNKLLIPGLAIMAGCFITLSCSKDVPHVADTTTGLGNLSNVQVFNATVKSVKNYIYVDNVPVSGAAVSYGGIFPATAYSFAVMPGARSFLIKDTSSTTTQVPITFSETLDAGKSYTIFTYDTLTSVKHATVLNNIVVPADSTARLRFGNFIYNATATPNVDVYSYRRGTGTPVFTNVASTQVTEFIPYASGLTDTLYVYATGTTSPVLVKSLVPSFTPSRSYTSVFSGSYKGTKGVGTFATY